ncbi:MAG: tRNA (adenosine(37)-N6)-threonylcarbamoyltransferase complex ATPase subunit type 1 TsaE [Planctomycetes bacterium]|nr:tRNA (adenosine(37)-N6)-threonylcarbamoyltransferase complex ATPase subunit type 1 TsaE [Planctomycetota bacterium]
MTEARIELTLADDPAATERLGERIGARLVAGRTVALSGPLGAGKTTFVRGLARGLGVDDPDEVSSPTYLLVIEHDGEVPLLHADAYLPAKLEGFLLDGGLEYLFDPTKVVCVEWAENVRNQLPRETLWVEITVGARPGRSVRLRTPDPGAFPWLTEFRTIWEQG